MTSHLTYANWEECTCHGECLYGTRVQETLETLKTFPLKWSELVYLGQISEVNETHRVWIKEDSQSLFPTSVFSYPNGEIKWISSLGYFDREEGPARVRANGDQYWYQTGQMHREDGPAAIYSDGSQEWYQNGVLHREDGPATINADGRTEWMKHGLLHRADGPAITYPDGSEEWYQNGKRHRVGGPAIRQANGSEEWWANGNRLNLSKKILKTFTNKLIKGGL